MNRIFLSLILITALLAGCNQNTNNGTTDEAELEALAYTLYTNKTELFVEFKPLVVGSQTRFAAHFTKLGERFTALTEGKITVSLIVNQKGIKQTVTAPSSPGIFKLALEPVKAGTGKLIFDIKAKDYTDQIIITGIPVYADIKSAFATQKVETASGEISYLKEQAWKVDFANIPVKRDIFYETIKASGQLLGAPGDEVTLVANTAGVVKFAEKENAPGVFVRSGQSLFTITGGGVTDNNIDVEIRNARAELSKAKADYERASALIKDKLIVQSEFTDAQLRYQNAQNQLNSLTRNYSSSGKGITSPISGFIKNIMVTEGVFVEAGQPLAIVGKNQKLILRAEVSQQYYPKLNKVKEAYFKTATSGDKTFNTGDLNGKLVSVGQSTASSPFIPVTFELNNNGELVSGSMAEIFLQSSPISNAIAIPVSSLIEEQGNFFVYVQTAGESFQKREVKTGSTNGVQVQIMSGLTEGERVVTKGAYQIKLATMSGAVPAHGHEH